MDSLKVDYSLAAVIASFFIDNITLFEIVNHREAIHFFIKMPHCSLCLTVLNFFILGLRLLVLDYSYVPEV